MFFQSGRRASQAKELWYPYWMMVSHKLIMMSLHFCVVKCMTRAKMHVRGFQGSYQLCGVSYRVLHSLRVLLASCVRVCSLLQV